MSHCQLRFEKNLEKLEISDIEFLIKNKIDESQNLEYKEPSRNTDDDFNYLSKTISGFLNTYGGIIIYGVSEKKENHHSYPSAKKYCSTPKERLENFLKSRIQPWENKIKILRIVNKENIQEGLFIIEVPKSNNPPHMFSDDYRYYQRLNYQTVPMNHQSVFRTFQTSWIRRRELSQTIIEPIYSEITEICEIIEKYEQGAWGKYSSIILHNRYLFDQIEISLRKKIDEFYRRWKAFNTKLQWIDKIVTRIINKKLCKFFEKESRWIESDIGRNCLYFRVKWKNPVDEIITEDHPTGRAILMYKTPEEYLRIIHPHFELQRFKPIRKTEKGDDKIIPDRIFRDIWCMCVSEVEKSVTIISLKNEQTKLIILGNEILESIE